MTRFRAALGVRDFFLFTLDALRYDVAMEALESGRAPHLQALVGSFERRDSPATFTFPAHQAFFAGFLPTPSEAPDATRTLALRFHGARSVDEHTLVLDAPSIVEGLRRAGYRTLCVGGTGFFDPGQPLGSVLPSMFDEAHWSRELGVASPHASRRQVDLAVELLDRLPSAQRCFLFINFSATHPPTRIFVPGAREESKETQAAALVELDRHLPRLVEGLRRRGGAVGIVCSDHGTCFGEGGHVGHRVAHPCVWTVPYAEVEVA